MRMRFTDILIENTLMENRVDFLRQKYLPIIAQISSIQDFENIDELSNQIFDKIVETDPTRNKQYVQWIIRIVLSVQDKTLQIRLINEDLYKITEDLEVFDRVKSRMPVEMRDIYKYETADALMKAVMPYMNVVSKAELDREEDARMYEQADVLLNNSQYKIVVPKTKEASCYFGKNTRWCTAAAKNNMFETYNEEGPLYIILDKKNNKRWQFHFESEQFMDELDQQINLGKWALQYPQLNSFFSEIIDQKMKPIFGNFLYNTRDDFVEFREPGKGFLGVVLSLMVWGRHRNIESVIKADPEFLIYHGQEISKFLNENGFKAHQNFGPLWLTGHSYYGSPWKFRNKIKGYTKTPAYGGLTWHSWYISFTHDTRNKIHVLVDTQNDWQLVIRQKINTKSFLVSDYGFSRNSENKKNIAEYILENIPEDYSLDDTDSDIDLSRFGGINFSKMRPHWFVY